MTTLEYLRTWITPYDVLHHAPVETAADHARILGVEPGQVAKTIVLDAHGRHALAVIPAAKRLDMHLVRRATGDPKTHLATEDEMLRDTPADVQLGATPPLGAYLHMPVYVDPEVVKNDTIVFPAGRRTVSVRMAAGDLLRGETATLVHLAADD